MKRRTDHTGDAAQSYSRPSRNDAHEDDLVELTRVASLAEAIAIRQDLERVGIRAVVFESDAGGWAPYLSVFTGNRVMVLAKDKARAELLLSETGGQLPADEALPLESRPPDTVRKHLRHHGDT